MHLNNISSQHKNGPSTSLSSSSSSTSGKQQLAKTFWPEDGFGQKHCTTFSSFHTFHGPYAAKRRMLTMMMSVGGHRWPLVTLLLLTMVLLGQQQAGECRYLPTRSHTNDLDKLRELMLQILESNSNEEPAASMHMSNGPAAMAPGADERLPENSADNWFNNLATWNNNEVPARKRYPLVPNSPPLRNPMIGGQGLRYY